MSKETDKIIERVIPSSESKDWKEAVLEWELTNCKIDKNQQKLF